MTTCPRCGSEMDGAGCRWCASSQLVAEVEEALLPGEPTPRRAPPPKPVPPPGPPAGDGSEFDFRPGDGAEAEHVLVVTRPDVEDRPSEDGGHGLHLVLIGEQAEPLGADQDVAVVAGLGERTTVRVRVRNFGQLVDAVELRVKGCPVEWVVLPEVVNLYPEASEELTVVFSPPRAWATQPGFYRVEVAAHLLNAPGVASNRVRLRLQVPSFMEPVVSMVDSPVGGRTCRTRVLRVRDGRFAVSVENRGNATLEVGLSVAAEDLVTRVWPVSLRVRPGSEARARVRATPRRAWVGAPSTHSVTVSVAWDGGEVATTLDVPVTHRPLMRKRTARSAIAAMALIAAVGGMVGTQVWARRPRAVPDVVGLQVAEAEAKLKDEGFQPTKVDVPDNGQPAGVVVDERPRAGSRHRKGSRVVLSVTPGPRPVEVPDVEGRDQAEAERVLVAQKLVVKVIERPDPDIAAGTVMAQRPAAREQVAAGSEVTLTVSTGKPRKAVPDLSGFSRSDAVTALGQIKLTLRVAGTVVDPARAGLIVNQDPPPGTEVPEGAEVAVTVAAPS